MANDCGIIKSEMRLRIIAGNGLANYYGFYTFSVKVSLRSLFQHNRIKMETNYSICDVITTPMLICKHFKSIQASSINLLKTLQY